MLLLCVILVTITTNQLVAGAATLTCTKTDTTMTFTITAESDATHVRLLAVDKTNDYASDNCFSSTYVSGVVTYHQLIVTVSLDGAGGVVAQIFPVITTTNDCKVKIEATTTQATLSILAETEINKIFANDIVYTPAMCDSATATASGVTLDIGSVTIGTLADQVLPETTAGTLVLSLIDAGTLEAITIPTIGTSVFILATYNRAAATGGFPMAANVHSLQVSNNADFTDDAGNFLYVDDITDSDGCKIAGAFFEPASTFKNTDPDPANNILTTATETSSKTGAVELAVYAMPATHTLWIKGFFTPCNNLDEKCVDQVAHCAGLRRRRRRSAEQGNSTQVMRIDVSMSGKSTTLNLGGDGSGTNDEFIRECKEATKFWIAAIVMGILLLIVLVFAVFLFYKLQNQRRHNHKAESTYVVQNPSF